MTTTVLLALVCLLAIVTFVQTGALVEMYGQLQQVRDHLEMYDTPTPLDLGRSQGVLASAVGLPAELDSSSHEVVLFLSNRCQTCYDIAGALAVDGLPPGLWVLVVSVSGGGSGVPEFVEQFSLSGDRLVLEDAEQIADRIGMDVTPAAITVRNGRLEEAQTVPTRRQLYALLPAAEPGWRLSAKLPLVSKTTGEGKS